MAEEMCVCVYVRCQVLVNPLIDFRSPSYEEYYRVYNDSALLSPSLLAMWYLLHLGIKPTRKNIRSVTENRHISAKLLGSEENRSLVDVSNLTVSIIQNAAIGGRHHRSRMR